MTLAERLLAIHHALEKANTEHAFGGAIALAYWTLDPRGTSDIDVNIFVPPDRSGPILDALPKAIKVTGADRRQIEADGQVRLWWDETPIDAFFNNVALHGDAARHRRIVPFADEQIPVLGPVELAVFKAFFNRTKDWADIEAMLAAETLDPGPVHQHLAKLLGPGDERLDRLAEAVALARKPKPGSA